MTINKKSFLKLDSKDKRVFLNKVLSLDFYEKEKRRMENKTKFLKECKNEEKKR